MKSKLSGLGLLLLGGLGWFGAENLIKPEAAHAGGVVSLKRAERIRSHALEWSERAPVVLMEAAEGDEGFILTDLVCGTVSSEIGTAARFTLTLESGALLGVFFVPRLSGGTEFTQFSYHLEAGIRIPAGARVMIQADSPAAHYVTVSGYTF